MEAKVKRGPQSWAYIYVIMGLAMAIEGTILQMMPFLVWPWNLTAYIVLMAMTWRLFTSSTWFQNKLIGFRRYEDEFH